MSHLELVKHYYDCFNHQNWPGMIACLDENVQHDSNQGETHFGLDHFRLFLEKMDESYAENLTDFTFMVDETGNRIAAEFVVHGIYKKTDEGLPPAHGQRYVLPVGAFFEVQNGKIRRITNYYNLNKWLSMVSFEF